MSKEISTISTRAILASCVALVLIAVIPYLNTLDASFHLDDYPNIVESKVIHADDLSCETLTGVVSGSVATARPIANISFALNYRLHGLDVTGYHVVNIVVHAFNSLLLFSLLIALLKLPGSSPWARERAFHIALVASALWATHPAGIQAVTYVVQRMTSLMTLFYLSALRLYVAARTSDDGRRRVALFSGALALWFLSLGTKENAAFGPAVIFGVELVFFRGLNARGALRLSLWCGLALLAAFAAMALAHMIPQERSLADFLVGGYRFRDFTLQERIFTQFRLLFRYLSLLLFPHPSMLNIDHDVLISTSLLDPKTTIPAIVAIEWAVLAVLIGARKRPMLLFFSFWFLGHLLIESSVIPLEMFFEHRLYLPSIGYCFLLAALIMRAVEAVARSAGTRKALLWAVSSMLLLLYGTWTFQRNTAWTDDLSLWQDAARKSPRKVRALNNLANIYTQMGKYSRAISKYRRIIDLHPGNAKVHNNLGSAYFKKGRFREAVHEYRIANQLNPNYAEAYQNLGMALRKLGDDDEAMNAYLRAIQLRPEYAEAHYNLGNIYRDKGREEDALAEYRGALNHGYEDANVYNNMGAIYFTLGSFEDAGRSFQKAISLDEQHALAWHNAALVYLKRGRMEEADAALERYRELRPDEFSQTLMEGAVGSD
ncbi:tetratricopeptide repeat protein [Thermodesulfobacteriota bacterium]